jgi:hypothetical protein
MKISKKKDKNKLLYTTKKDHQNFEVFVVGNP